MYFTVSIEVQIVLAICLFYGYDTALLLKPEEGLLRKSRSGWLAQLASQGFELRQNWLLWPSIFAIHQPVYRLHWNATQITLPGDARPATALATHASSFRAFILPLYLLGVLLFVALPVSLLVLHSELAQLITLALIYLCTAWISVLAWNHGKSDKATARSIAVQILLCPPFALNVVRKLSLAYGAQPDLLQTTHALMDTPQWSDFAQQVQSAMQREMHELADLPEYAQHLEQMQQALHTLKASTEPSTKPHASVAQAMTQPD
ncbi:MAG: hypothetical protein RR800_04595 [Comamonas sp.]